MSEAWTRGLTSPFIAKHQARTLKQAPYTLRGLSADQGLCETEREVSFAAGCLSELQTALMDTEQAASFLAGLLTSWRFHEVGLDIYSMTGRFSEQKRADLEKRNTSLG